MDFLTYLKVCSAWGLAAFALSGCSAESSCFDRGLDCGDSRAGMSNDSGTNSDAGLGGGGHGGTGTSGNSGVAGEGPDGGACCSDASMGGVSGEGGGPMLDADDPCASCNGNTPFCNASNECVACLNSAVCTTEEAPRCDTSGSYACTECEGASDCTKFPSTPNCETVSGECVACLSSTTCTTESAPRCDTAGGHVCAGCEGAGDCSKFSATPNCETGSGECVECTADSQCPAADASNCGPGNTCTPCENNTDCSHVSGKNVCDDGLCVECTVEEEAECGGTSCDPATRECTDTDVGSLDYCEPCLADSECDGGNQEDPDVRCVPMEFNGAPRVGGFCLRRVSKTCSRPYAVTISGLVSFSGASAESYCGIDEASTRCEAVLDLIAGQACGNGTDTSCGCARSQDGGCIGSGAGGLCETVGGIPNQCTYPCGTSNDCPAGKICTGGDPYCH